MAKQCKTCSRWFSPDEEMRRCPQCGGMESVTVDENEVVNNKRNVAFELARKHFNVEPGISKIFRISGSADVEARPIEPIKLLEVNKDTFPSGVMPLHFGPAPQINVPFSSVIVEITPEEFDRLASNELKLPEGWRIDEEIFPEASAVNDG